MFAAASSGVLFYACMPPANLWFFAPVAWVPLLASLRGSSALQAATLGLVHGLVCNGLVLWWVPVGITKTLSVGPTWVAALFLVLLIEQASRSVAIATITRFFQNREASVWIVTPILVLIEGIWPLILPWYTASLAHAFAPWQQSAEFGGPLLVSAWLATCNAGVFGVIQNLPTRLWPARLLPAAMLIVAATVFGYARQATLNKMLSKLPTIRVGVVQGAASAAVKESRDLVPDYRDRSIRLLSRAPDIDLIVWPETAVSYPIAESDLPRVLRSHILGSSRNGPKSQRVFSSLLFGVVLKEGSSTVKAPPEGLNSDATQSNAAVLVDSAVTSIQEYRKRKLAPFAEGDISLSWFGSKKILARSGEPWRAGDSPASLAFGHWRIGVSICYEDLHKSLIRQTTGASSPDVLVNLSSDAWFRGTAASQTHLALAKIRAVEHGRYFLRVVNSGISALVDPGGHVAWSLPDGIASEGIVSIPMRHTSTIYDELGDTPLLFASLLVTGFALIRRRPKSDLPKSRFSLRALHAFRG